MNCKHNCLRLSKDGLGGTYYTCEDCGAITTTTEDKIARRI